VKRQGVRLEMLAPLGAANQIFRLLRGVFCLVENFEDLMAFKTHLLEVPKYAKGIALPERDHQKESPI